MTTRPMARAGAAVVLMLAGLAGAVEAQSLAEVARQEAERRARVTVPGKVYTNGDLTPDFTKPLPPTDQAGGTSPDKPREADPAAPAGAPAPADASTTIAPAGSKPADGPDGVTPRDRQAPQPLDDKGEAYWRNQAQLIRTRLANQNAQITQLRAREGSFAPGVENAERALVQQTLQKAIADLEFLNAEWLGFERLARERKIPENWIR